MTALEREVLRFLETQGVTLAGKTVLCAVSGGRDSMALLHMLLKLSGEIGFAVTAAHYNHCLRESAGRDEMLVRVWCGERGIPLVVGSGDVAACAKAAKTSVEAAARTMRYRFLEETAAKQGADLIATAHHRQDNAETLLLHLLRGAGLQGLSGIPPVRGRIVRPLLETDRAEIDRYISENGIPYGEDETNSETVYERNRLRHEFLPLLEGFSPGACARIADTAARLRVDNLYLERQAAALLPPPREDGETLLPRALLNEQDAAIAVRLVRLAARRMDLELTAAQAEGILALRTGARITLPGGLRAAAEGKYLRFYRTNPLPPPMPLKMGVQSWGGTAIRVKESGDIPAEDERCVVLCPDTGELIVAPWDGTGRLAVENGRRTVKRLLSDHGIPPIRQESRPAIFVRGKLAAVFGAGTDREFRPQQGEKCIVITLADEDKDYKA